jgi:hypothetical protein
MKYHPDHQKEIIMTKKILDNVRMGKTWTSYIASMEGVLRKGGLWNGETYMLMGMTGMAFNFIIHKTVCPSSVTVYDWDTEHFAMTDRIGIFSRCISSMKNFNTQEFIIREAMEEIKESIDNGIPVITWAPTRVLEFGIIRGYDDDEKIFNVVDCMSENPDPLLYDNLGKSEVPILFVQRFLDKVEPDVEKIYRDSLKYGVEQWNKPADPNSDYASGKKAYEYLIGSLKKGDFNEFGLSYNLAVYADSKSQTLNYLKEIARTSRETVISEKILDLYGSISEKFNILAGLIPFKGPDTYEVNKEIMPKVLKLAEECSYLENEAMSGIGKAVSV